MNGPKKLLLHYLGTSIIQAWRHLWLTIWIIIKIYLPHTLFLFVFLYLFWFYLYIYLSLFNFLHYFYFFFPCLLWLLFFLYLYVNNNSLLKYLSNHSIFNELNLVKTHPFPLFSNFLLEKDIKPSIFSLIIFTTNVPILFLINIKI